VRIQSLTLEHFRSHDRRTFDFTKGDLHLFVGQNGSGKTNILEAISILSHGSSCLGCEEQDLPTWGTEYFRVGADAVFDAGDPQKIEVFSQITPRKQKAAFVNGVRCPVSSIVGMLPTVLFLPQDLYLFTGPPSERRRFLDQILIQVSPEYHAAHAAYQKIVRQRNTLLKNITEGLAKAGDLAVWDAQVAEHGSIITLHRLELMETFGLTLRDEMRSFGERPETVRVRYIRKGEKRERAALTEELRGLLLHYRERDILLQSTTIGPHRDDWHLDVDGRALESFASRGQQRTAVLALLFLQVSFLTIRRGETPVILLDDVFSELDDRHQEGVLASFAGHQVLITTTHAPKQLSTAIVWDMQTLVGDTPERTKAAPNTNERTRVQ